VSVDEPLAATPAEETVVVAAGEQSPRRRAYHKPAGPGGLEAACGRLQLDGQRLPRGLADDQRFDPCPDCFAHE
jgi:hypothetical protein